MLINIFYGLPTMAVCLVLEALLLVVALRYYVRHKTLINTPSFASTLRVVTGVMILLVIGNIARSESGPCCSACSGSFPISILPFITRP